MESTPRPTISVENLNVNLRRWPGNKLCELYVNERRFCFRLGKLNYNLWQWPWPEWI